MKDVKRYAITWSETSRRNLEAIHSYIHSSAPLAAQRFSTALFDAVESLKDQPFRGRIAGDAVRELIMSPYVIRYRVSGSMVRIVRIRHGARRPD